MQGISAEAPLEGVWRGFSLHRILKVKEEKRVFFCNRHYSLMRLGGSKLYNLEAMPFTSRLSRQRLLSSAFWKIITALKRHMTCYNLNLNSWQNESWDCLTVPFSIRSLSNNFETFLRLFTSFWDWQKMNLGSNYIFHS